MYRVWTSPLSPQPTYGEAERLAEVGAPELHAGQGEVGEGLAQHFAHERLAVYVAQRGRHGVQHEGGDEEGHGQQQACHRCE